MYLKEFVKTVVLQIDAALSEAREISARDILITNSANSKSVEFDIAVTAESGDISKIGGVIKVLEFFSLGTESTDIVKNESVSRIKFGINLSDRTKVEQQEFDNQLDASFGGVKPMWPEIGI